MDYDKALKLAPDRADLYLSRGFAQSSQANKDAAIADLTKARDLSKDPALTKQATEKLTTLQP